MEPAGRSGPSSYSTSQQDSFFAQAAHVSPDLAELGGAPDTYFGYQEKGETKLVVFTTQGDKTYIIKPNGGGCTVQEGMFPKNYATLDAFLNTFSPKPTYKLPDPFEASQQFLKSHIWVERDVKTLMGGACAVRTTKKGYELVFRPQPQGEERLPLKTVPLQVGKTGFIAKKDGKTVESPNIVTLVHQLGISRIISEDTLIF